MITGGSRGIGRAISLGLAARGIRTLIINYLENDAAAEATKAEVEAGGVDCRIERANLAYPGEINDLFRRVRSVIDRLDIFIHCAALGTFKPLSEVKPNQWDLSMAVNARAFVQCVQQCLPLMEHGKIVAISSLGSRQAVPNYGAIGPSKAALEASIRQLAAELAPRGIQINGVSGGFIQTESMEKFPGYTETIDKVVNETPAKRPGTPGDIAGAVFQLLSPESGWIHGQVLVADGGFSLT